MAKKKNQLLTKKQKRQLLSLVLALLLAALGYIGSSNHLAQDNPIKQLASMISGQTSKQVDSNGSLANQSSPNKDLADTVVTATVRQELGGDLEWNGAGAYIL